MENLIKRIITSLILIIILFSSLFYFKNIWLLLLILTSIISYLEFYNLIKKIFKKQRNKIYFLNIICICYLTFFTYAAFDFAKFTPDIFLVLLICIFSDIGGYVVGKTIGGKKLTKISPNKTVAGTIGSFIFSIIPIVILSDFFTNLLDTSLLGILIYTIFISFICQSGDLFISYFKRKAKVKDSGAVLPGHGGILDRIDGILFAIPTAFIISEIIS